jgi:hypothetical protein
MSQPPPLPARKLENQPPALDFQATPSGLAPPLPVFAPPPLPPRNTGGNDQNHMEATGSQFQPPSLPADSLVQENLTSHENHVPPVPAEIELVPSESFQSQTHTTSRRENIGIDIGGSSNSGENPQVSPVQTATVQPPTSLELSPVPEPEMSASTHRQTFPQSASPQNSPVPLSATTQASSARPAPPPLPARRPSDKFAKFHTPPQVTDNQDPHIPLPLPSLPVVLLLIIPVTLAYFQISLIGLILACLGSWYIWAEWKRKKIKRTDFDPEVDRDRVKGLKPQWEHERYKDESVNWMNHALRALFPLINTDILTPFIDLVEDALLSYVPPIVVRTFRATVPQELVLISACT